MEGVHFFSQDFKSGANIFCCINWSMDNLFALKLGI